MQVDVDRLGRAALMIEGYVAVALSDIYKHFGAAENMMKVPLILPQILAKDEKEDTKYMRVIWSRPYGSYSERAPCRKCKSHKLDTILMKTVF